MPIIGGSIVAVSDTERLDIVIDLRQSLQRGGTESCQKGLVLPLVQMGTQLP